MTTGQPYLDERTAEPYLAIPFRVRAGDFATAVDSGFPELFAWLAQRGVEPAGAPFIRYLVIDMEGEFEIELAVPVATAVDGDERVVAGTLPGGRYATLLHVGGYDQLVAANGALDAWVAREGIALDTWPTERGSAWRARIERYLTDPRAEPDASRWETEIAFLTAV